MSEIEKALAVKEKVRQSENFWNGRNQKDIFLQAGSISGTRSLKAMTGL
jgi:hypothetical protein